jgi:spore coat protein U-like protein
MSTPSVVSVTAAMLLVFASGLSVQSRAAGTATTPIPVSATVSQACSIGTTASLVFGAYDPIGTNATAALNATGQVSVACSKGATGLKIGMDNGAHVAGTQRTMTGLVAGNTLNYNIFQPPATPGAACAFPGSVAWTNTDGGTMTLTNASGKAARLYNVCGTIPGGQDVGVDTYADVVNATINF